MSTNNKKQKVRRVGKVSSAIVVVKVTRNNILVVVTDTAGNVLLSGSGGKSGFKGPRRCTPHACRTIIASLVNEAINSFGVKTVSLIFRLCSQNALKTVGVPTGETLDASGVIISEVSASIPTPHGGCRLKRRRSV